MGGGDAQLQNVIHPFGTNASFQCSNGVVPAQIGISVDLLTNLPQQTEEITPESSVSADKMTQFTRFAAESLFNYVASFARDNSTSDPLVPMSAIKRWFDTMLQKLSLDASFWRK
uniref:Protein Hikeshi n=2 Tax=Schistosoma TaxID=6181 RepID=A0A094ZZ28_SCHHA